MKKTLLIITAAIGIFFLPSCGALFGEEVGRIPVNEISTNDSPIVKETSLDLKKGDKIAIWSEMDMEYEGFIGFRFKMEIYDKDELIDTFYFDPAEKNPSVGEVKSTFGQKTSWRFSGKNATYVAGRDGNLTFKASLESSENSTLDLKKAEVVLKK
ncbi:MAG: hypothetical protein HRT74_04405 [Flavobacteriales bacterium]|nr:hypothetical protein [Flavobacteriales bacterium]